MSRKAWIVLAVGSLAGFPAGILLEDSNSAVAALVFAVSIAIGIFAVMKCFRPRARAVPARGLSYRDVALLRSLALGFVVAIGIGVLVLGPVLESHSGDSAWLLLGSPAGGAATFFLTLLLQVRRRDELGDPSVPLAGVIRRRR